MYHLRLTALCFALVACDAGGIGGPQDGKPPVNPNGGDVGATCSINAQCKSDACFKGTCAATCSGASQCNANQDCGSDDGKRLICHARGYNAAVGRSCAVSGACPGGLKCVGGGKLFGRAYCTASCGSDLDCPSSHTCRQVPGSGKICARRDFCAPCQYDAQCGSNARCVNHGGRRFCARRCQAGHQECPSYARCQAVGGQQVCVHKSGACVGNGAPCSACNDSTQCKQGGACVSYSFSDETFCAAQCSGGKCASGYWCDTKNNRCLPTKATCVPPLTGMMKPGDVMDDYTLVGYADSNNDGRLSGESLRLIRLSDYAKKHKIILLSVATGWCTSCKEEAKQFASLMQTYGSKGLVIVTTLTDGVKVNTPPTVGLLNNWISAYKPAGAAGIDPGNVAARYNGKGTVPLNMIIDAKTRRVLDKWNEGTIQQLKSRLAAQMK